MKIVPLFFYLPENGKYNITSRILAFLTLGFFFIAIHCTPSLAQQTVKVMHYNLLQFGNSCPPVTVNQKVEWLNVILNFYQPDILTVNELAPQRAYAQNIRLNAFNYTDEIEFGAITNTTNSQIVNTIFYNSSLFGYKGVDVIDGGFRDINVYTLYTQASVANSLDTTFLYCIVTHFKAGNNTNDFNIRNSDAELISNWIANNPDKENVLLMGDLNVGSANEDGFEVLVKNVNQDIRFVDPTGKSNGWGGQANAEFHTQSTRSNQMDCGSTGGMDDRFDFILTRPSIMDGSKGITYVSDSYAALGNDGSSYNNELSCNGQAVPLLICISLKQMSDHLPVVLELEIDGAIPTSVFRDISEAGMSVSNPFSENLVINSERTSSSHYQVALTDMLGRIETVGDLSFSQSQISIPTVNLAPGLYLLTMIDQQTGKTWGRKLIKQ